MMNGVPFDPQTADELLARNQISQSARDKIHEAYSQGQTSPVTKAVENPFGAAANYLSDRMDQQNSKWETAMQEFDKGNMQPLTNAATDTAMLMAPMPGVVRKLPNGKLLGTVSQDSLGLGEKFVQRDLGLQAKEAGLISKMPRGTGKAFVDAQPEFLHPMLEQYKARFGDGITDKQWSAIREKALNKNAPYFDLPNKSAVQYPNYEATPTGKIGDPKAFASGDGAKIYKADPFKWSENKFGASKKLLEEHLKLGLPVTVHTSSDLIASDAYVNALPKGSKVNIVIPSARSTEEYRIKFPNLPSEKRLLNAFDKLIKSGIDAKILKSERGTLKELDPFSARKAVRELNAEWKPPKPEGESEGYAHGGIVGQNYHMHAEDDRSFTIRHPDGTHFLVAKEGLDDRTIGKIRSMGPVKPFKDGLDQVPHLAEGGFVPTGDAEIDRINSIPQITQEGNIPQTQEMIDNLPYGVGETNFGTGQLMPLEPPQTNDIPFMNNTPNRSPAGSVYVDPASLATSQPAQQPQAQPVAAQTSTSGLPVEYTRGIQEQASAQKQLSKQNQASIESYKHDMEVQNKLFNERRAAIDLEHETLSKNYADGKIDANRLWNNMGTGNKVLAGISLVLGGIGGALTRSPNAALQVIDNAIDRDIDSQKANLGKTQSLLSLNMQKYRNLEAAEAATKNQYLTILQTQLQINAAKAGTPQAQAAADMAIGQAKAAMEANNAKIMGEYAKELRKTEVSGPGFSGYARNEQGANDIRNSVASIGSAEQSINRLIEIAKAGGRRLFPDETVAEVNTLRLLLQGSLREAVLGPGTVQENERKMLQELIANPTKILQLDANTIKTLETIKSVLNSGLKNKARAWGVQVSDDAVGFKAKR